MRWRVFCPSPPPLTDTALLAQALATVAPQVTALTAHLPGLVHGGTPLLARWPVLDLPASAAHTTPAAPSGSCSQPEVATHACRLHPFQCLAAS
jgi:hypothetical protein